MDKNGLERIKRGVEAIFPGAESCEVRLLGDDVHVEVSQMYEYLPLAYKELKKLAELFGTDDFGVNQESAGGCETCDWGSRYSHEFTYQLTK
jgi:hypothetical protein